MEERNLNQEIIQPKTIENSPIKKKKTWLIIILITFLIILYGAIGVFAYTNYLLKHQTKLKENILTANPTSTTTPTQTPTQIVPTTKSIAGSTADWETYTNVLYKFSYKYPLQAETKEIITQAEIDSKVLFAIDTSEVGATQVSNTELYDGYSFTVVVVEKTPTKTIDNISGKYISNCNEVGDLTKSPKNITINAIVGVTFSCRGLGEFTYVLLPAPKINSYYFEIRTSYEGPNKINYQEIIGQILSTFKFTN